MKRILAAGAALLALAQPLHAQNIAANSGIWWGGPSGPGAFTVLNPATTIYGRFAVLHDWRRDTTPTGGPTGVVPAVARLDGAWGGGLGIGARLMPVLRVEANLGGSFGAPVNFAVGGLIPGGTTSITTRLSSVQAMGNAFIDLAPIFGGLGGFNLYVGAGIGVALNRLADSSTTFTDPFNGRDTPTTILGGGGRARTNFAWQAMAGAQMQLLPGLILDLSYAYLDAGHAEIAPSNMIFGGQSYRLAVRSHRAMVGLVVPLDGMVRSLGN